MCRNQGKTGAIRPRPWLRRLLALGLGCLLALVLAEGILRIHNPLGLRLRGNEILLPTCARYEFDNRSSGKLDGHIVHTKNSLGFGGVEGCGADSWLVLELYNDVTRSVAKTHRAALIDLAARMPRDSRYYRDLIHFGNEGVEKVGAIVAEELAPVIEAGRAAR